MHDLEALDTVATHTLDLLYYIHDSYTKQEAQKPLKH